MDFNMEKAGKKRNFKLQEDKQRNVVDSLPRELALDVFSRLSITSVMQSRFVCRSWQNLSLDKNLVTLHLSQVMKRDPLLVFYSNFPIRNQLCFAELPGIIDDAIGIVKKINIPFPASMPEFTVVGSCNGLLCLCDSFYKDAVYIYNPFTNDYMELPKTRQYDEELVVCGFGYHPESNQLKIVKIVHYMIATIGEGPVRRFRVPRSFKSEVLVISSGDNTWRNIGQAPYYVEMSQEALFTHGRLHWLALGVDTNVRGSIIISFDLADEKFHVVPRPDFNSPFDSRNYQLVSLKGCLSAVAYEYGLYNDLEIWVMKEYNVKESWNKEFKIRGKIPESPSTKLPQPLQSWRNSFCRALVTVLRILDNGEILIEYKVGRLALYDPISGRYKNITFKGMPGTFQTVLHMGSLNQIALHFKS